MSFKNLNRVQLIGRLGSDPKIIETKNTDTMVSFSIATTETYKDKNGDKVEKTHWHNIVGFGGLADAMIKNLKKGNKVYIEGKLEPKQFENKEGVKQLTYQIVAEFFEI